MIIQYVVPLIIAVLVTLGIRENIKRRGTATPRTTPAPARGTPTGTGAPGTAGTTPPGSPPTATSAGGGTGLVTKTAETISKNWKVALAVLWFGSITLVIAFNADSLTHANGMDVLNWLGHNFVIPLIVIPSTLFFIEFATAKSPGEGLKAALAPTAWSVIGFLAFGITYHFVQPWVAPTLKQQEARTAEQIASHCPLYRIDAVNHCIVTPKPHLYTTNEIVGQDEYQFCWYSKVDAIHTKPAGPNAYWFWSSDGDIRIDYALKKVAPGHCPSYL